MKRSLGPGEWIRRGLGVAMLAGVVAIASGLDTGLLPQVSLASTNGIEQALVDHLHATTNASAAEPIQVVTKVAPAMKAGSPLPVIHHASFFIVRNRMDRMVIGGNPVPVRIAETEKALQGTSIFCTCQCHRSAPISPPQAGEMLRAAAEPERSPRC